MKKSILLMIIIMLLLVCNIYASLENEYEHFTLINAALVNENKQYKVNQNLILQMDDNQYSNIASIGLYSGNSQILKINETKEQMFVLSTSKGNWLYNKKLKSPLKIGASWSVNDLDIQDILRIDFEYGYHVNGLITKESLSDITYTTEFVELIRDNRNYLYPYVYFTTYNNNDDEFRNKYIMVFCDNDQKPIKSAIYTEREINSKLCFGYIEIRSHAFNKNQTTICEIEKIEEVKVPKVLFSSSKIKEIIEYLE